MEPWILALLILAAVVVFFLVVLPAIIQLVVFLMVGRRIRKDFGMRGRALKRSRTRWARYL